MGSGVGWALSPVALVNHVKESGLSSPLLSSIGGLENPPSGLGRWLFLRLYRSGFWGVFLFLGEPCQSIEGIEVDVRYRLMDPYWPIVTGD